MQLATDLGYVHTTAADPGKGPGAPRGPSLRLDQTETRRAEKNLFWDRASPLSQGLDDRPPFFYLKVWIRHCTIADRFSRWQEKAIR